MEVFKFGGASVKDANGVRNLVSTLHKLDKKEVLIVISAMGKMTNAFEDLVNAYFLKTDKLQQVFGAIKSFHFDIIDRLDFKENDFVAEQVEAVFFEITQFFNQNQETDYDYIYDQVVSRAEFLSTRICSAYLNDVGLINTWLDVRECIKTNSDFRRAKVNWDKTSEGILKHVDTSSITITQGFIGKDNKGRTTTLGREGSDYTAGIFAFCLDAKEVSIFKDVQGVLNADPREFEQTTLIEEISYREAIEMAFYGASVIHPKTLQPLQRKGIPLRVRSFLAPEKKGTYVGSELDIVPEIPCFIVKKNQILISVADKEFHFVMEQDISEIFKLLHEFKVKANMIQNSAISFSLCIEDNFNNFKELMAKLKPKYKVKYNENVSLYTIRHFNEEVVSTIEDSKEVLLKQRSRETVQLIVKG
ncbi:aspartate kinase [Lutimonas halocynthiae]|uniref:aspartate kinase n=1 Tax=Lutimonas halocynthiae TaxID=1446477 RepID=UPI0025B2EFC7|nr:aspartate kinase [Lutimonas halocynthiae]MDN3641095.1 aspartate kinase [Lutimonas halocynthiae]